MPGWKLVREEHPHFVVQGNDGEFRIHQDKVAPATAEKWRAMCRGGTAMADGGVASAADDTQSPEGHVPAPIRRVLAKPEGKASSSPSVFDAAKAIRDHNARLEEAANAERMADGGMAGQPDVPDVSNSPEVGGEIPADAEHYVPPMETPESWSAPTTAHYLSGQTVANDPVTPPTPVGGPAPSAAPSGATQPPEMLARPSSDDGNASVGVRTSGLMMPPTPPMTDWDRVQRQLDKGQALGEQGADLKAQAEAQKAVALTAAHAEYADALKKAEAARVADTREVQRQIDTTVSDIESSKIDPNHFWSDKSAFGKVSAGLGMILSGIGSGMTGAPNLAAQFIQRQIDNDIDAQKANLGKKQNLLGYMLKKYGNIQEAAVATRAYLTASLAGQVGLAAARAGGQEAQSAAALLKSQLASQAVGAQAQIVQGRHADAWQRYQMEWQQRLMQQMGMSAQPQGGYVPSSAHPPMLAEPSLKGIQEMQKDDNERRVNLPELGAGAYTHAQTAKDAEESKSTLGALANLEGQVNQLAQTARSNPMGVHMPGSEARAKYQSFASSLTTELNKLQGLNRLNENEYHEFGNMIPTEREWFSGQGAAKIAALKQHIMAKRLEEYQSKLGLRIGQRPVEMPIAGRP